MQLVIAEKPSVARDLARVLGVRASGKDAFESTNWVITWCIGHLVELDEPASYDPQWKSWRLDVLPMVPSEFRLRPSKHAAGHLKVVRALLRDKRFSAVINACDAGREGELIFRYVYQYAGARLPARRLWISSLTDEAIKRGLAGLRPAVQLDPLADAARSRSEADWLVGMNATRAVTVKNRAGGHTALYSIGRVQTPTLAMIVAREQAIRAFVPRDYWELRADFTTAEGRTFSAAWRHGEVSRLGSAAIADEIVVRDRGAATASLPHGPRVESVRAKTVREPPPLLFDLTSLQRTANRRFGFTATRTLELAQALYERHKVLTYPRTDSRHLSNDLAGELPELFGALAALPDYAAFAAPLLAAPPPISRRVFDDAKVHDHHAIIPTGAAIRIEALDRDERRLFDLVARRFLGAFHGDAEIAVTEAWIRVGAATGAPLPSAGKRGDDREPVILEVAPPPPDRYFARGRVRLVAGWQAVAGIDEAHAEPGDKGEPVPVLPPLVEGQALDGVFGARAKQTTPPPRYTEATLLGAMESAGKTIDDEALRAAMKDSGLGTPATRAAIIETLLRREFIVRDRQQLVPTATGTGLIEALPVASLASPELTGTWEARLARIARGEDTRAAFMADIARYVATLVDAIRGSTPAPPPVGQPAAPSFSLKGGRGRRPRSGGSHAPAGRRNGRRGGGGGRSTPHESIDVPDALRDDAPAHDSRPQHTPNGTWPNGNARSSAQPSPPPAAPSTSRIALQHDDGIVAALRATARGAGASTASYRTAAPTLAPATSPTAQRPPVPTPAPSPQRPAARAPRPKRSKAAASVATDALTCPRCRAGTLLTGARGWGCSRWREGCRFVIWFETAGRTLTAAQLRELITRGKTRKATFVGGDGRAIASRLVLDATAATPVRIEPA